MAPQPRPPAPPTERAPSPRPAFWRTPGFWVVVAVLLLANWVVGSALVAPESRLQVPYTEFQSQLTAGNVTSVTSKGEKIQGHFRKAVTYPKGSADTAVLFQTQRPSYAKDDLLKALDAQHVTVNAEPVQTSPSLFTQLLVGFGPTLLLIGGFLWLYRRMGAGLSSSMGGFGRSRAKRYDASRQRTTFADVAGVDEVKDELAEVVDFLRNPLRYRRLGATIPRGVLLSGPPGTGKTLLARAVAGEAGVPFFSVSASEFVEMIVGVGASRVRDLFVEAKAVAPAIVFIDELDGIGQSRTGGSSFGANDEREQTLNQILTEMDGFSGTEGVIVLGATNRPEVLDPALLRPGRFDRRVTVNPPDLAGRAAILRVHTRGVPLAGDVDLSAIAAQTPGMVGADLRNLVNEAALLSARRRRDRVYAADFADALEKLMLGTARRIVLSPQERERSAYHESGHALLGMLQPGADPVRKVSIVPRGRALGVTFQSADADRYAYEEPYLRGRIIGALGGRAAEQLVYGHVTTGAESDLEQVTVIARQMVGRWGMSDAVGPVAILPPPGMARLPMADGPSPDSLRLVDAEVRRIVDECYAAALDLLRANRDRLDALARTLLEHETLDEADAYRAAGFPAPASTARVLDQVAGDGRAATA
jgi:cell division protease FtsH